MWLDTPSAASSDDSSGEAAASFQIPLPVAGSGALAAGLTAARGPGDDAQGVMAMASLGSGSKGNGTLIRTREALVLVDCGFTLKETEARLARLGVHPSQLDAVLVTHEHGDHLSGVGPLARRHGVPVHLTTGTWLAGRAKKLGALPSRHLITPQQEFAIKDLEILPVTVPHDAREPVQFVFNRRGETATRRLGVLTDLGHVSEHVLQCFADCDALVMEFNHDPQMLASGPYPPSLKRRVGGRLGHLANAQACAALPYLGLARLQRLVASHLSESNNHPSLAREALAPWLADDDSRLIIAAQDSGFGWQAIA